MNNRQEKILQALLDQHLLTGQPVSSNLLAEKLGLDVSSATVRNELAQLTEEGYISQPHTSAGRLPTVAAYRWLIQRLNDQEIDEEQAEHWEQSLGQENQESETYFKQTAKALA